MLDVNDDDDYCMSMHTLHARMHTFELKLLCIYKYANDWIQINNRPVKKIYVDEAPN